MLKDSFYLHLLHHSSEINPRELNQGTSFWTNLMTGNFWEEWMFVHKHFSKVSILFCVSLNYKHQVVTPQNSCHWWICPKPNSWELNTVPSQKPQIWPQIYTVPIQNPEIWTLIYTVPSQNPEIWTQSPLSKAKILSIELKSKGEKLRIEPESTLSPSWDPENWTTNLHSLKLNSWTLNPKPRSWELNPESTQSQVEFLNPKPQAKILRIEPRIYTVLRIEPQNFLAKGATTSKVTRTSAQCNFFQVCDIAKVMIFHKPI